MGFYFETAKKEAAAKPKTRARSGHVPIAAMNAAGCSVCPRDKDRSLHSPKMEPEGSSSALVYLLSSRPTHDEDKRGALWDGIAGREILKKMRNFSMRDLRLNNIVNCSADDLTIDVKELECCRSRVVADIEDVRPLVVIGVGDEPLHWATGLPRNANTFRGRLIATKIGKHVCWYYPVLYPNYTERESYKKSEYEVALEHDIAFIDDELANGLTFPTVYDAPYDTGIELITGQEAGDMQRLEDALHWLCSLPHGGLDLETSGIKPHMEKNPKIWTASAGSFDRTIAFAIDHPDGWGTETRQRKARHMFGEYLMQSGRKRCHNLAFEQEWCAYFYGQQILRRTEWDDTMAMGFTFDERPGTKGLDEQCRVNFGFFLKAQSPVRVDEPDWINKYSIKQVLRYNGLDSKWTDKLADVYLAKMQEDERSASVYERRMRTCPTLVLTTAQGLPIDLDYAKALVEETDFKLQGIEDKIRKAPEVRQYTARFGTFSPTNPDHVLKMMKDICKRPEVMRTDRKGKVKWTSDEEALAAMPASEVPSAPLILEHRGLTRNETTYLLPLIEGKLTSWDGKLRAEYNQLHTVTGRLSSPMHNWPKHKYKEVRGAVAAPAGQWFVAADQGQIEFRVVGMLSEDRNIVKYCWTGYDVHAFWAQRMVDEFGPVKDWIVEEFKVDWDEKGLKTLRQVAKNNWVFPQLFGSTTDSCARNCHLPEDVAEYLGKEFWDEFRGAKKWQEKTIDGFNRNLYVETMGGVRRRGPTTVNELINMPIQGTACEIVLDGMNALSELSDVLDRPELHPAFNGHDDLSFIISDERLENNITIITREMCRPRYDYIIVPLIVEVSVGPRWHELEEIGKFSSEHLFNLPNPYK